jgi:hypothetical protein
MVASGGLFVVPGEPHSGGYNALFIPVTNTVLMQTLITTINGVYNLSFWLASASTTPSFNVMWGSQLIASINPIPSDYTLYQYTVVATDVTTDLSFTPVSNPDNIFLDDVSAVGLRLIAITSPCFHGNSKVLTKNLLNDKIEIINASDILSTIHEVFSINNKYFYSSHL